MAKKKNQAEKDFLASSKAVEKSTPQKETKSAKKKDKKPGVFKRLGAKVKDVFSELKKVSWPSFGKVVKNTGIVLVVVLAFLVVITAFDTGLSYLVNLL